MANTQTGMTDEQPMIDAWTKLSMDADAAAAVRASIAHAIPDDWVVETNPHISVLPGFELPTQNADEATDALETGLDEFVGDTLTVNGFHCFNPIESDDATFVIALDVDINLDSTRSRQQAMVEACGGDLHFDPVPAHITLFKQGDGGDDHRELTADEQAAIETALENAYVPDTITVVGAGAEQY